MCMLLFISSIEIRYPIAIIFSANILLIVFVSDLHIDTGAYSTGKSQLIFQTNRKEVIQTELVII